MKTSFTIGALLGILFTLLEQKQAWRNWIPSPTGIGIGMLIPISAVSTMFLGAFGDWVWSKVQPASHQRYSIPLASGCIAGEALVAVIIPLLVTIGWLKLP
jgi:uncharacterized oligopeptide transporter (OPT) family protein